MNKIQLIRIIIAIIVVFIIGIIGFYLFFYDAPPISLDYKYLAGTTEIVVYERNPESNSVIINRITNEQEIQNIIYPLEFRKYPAGAGLSGPTKYQAVFSSNSFSYTLYFDHSIAEISFYPETIFSKWSTFTIQSGTLVPVYKVVLDQDILNKLLTDG